MFLLRRRSDNKYYVNKILRFRVYNRSLRRYETVQRQFWVDDPNECVPFPTITVARASATRHVQCPYPILDWATSTNEQRNVNNVIRSAWFSNDRARRAERDLNYEIVPITYNVGGGVNEGTGNIEVPPQEEV